MYLHCKHTQEEQETDLLSVIMWVCVAAMMLDANTVLSTSYPSACFQLFALFVGRQCEYKPALTVCPSTGKLQVWQWKMCSRRFRRLQVDEFAALTVVFTLLVSLCAGWRCSRRQTLDLTPCSQWHREEWTCSKWVWAPGGKGQGSKVTLSLPVFICQQLTSTRGIEHVENHLKRFKSLP